MAAAVTADFLERHPDWLERYGDLARQRGLEDARFHADFLAAALEAGSADAFGSYARWTASVLESRNIDRTFLVENLRQIGDWYARALEPAMAAECREVIARGIAATAEPPTTGPEPGGPLSNARSVFIEACLRGDRGAALGVVQESMHAGHRLSDIYVELIQESQYEVGRRWQANRITVAQEHVATAVAQYVVARVYPDLERPATHRGRAVVSGVEGELHQLGANLVADLLESYGWNVRFLGTNVPIPDVVRIVDEHRATLVGISATMLPSLPKVRTLIEQLRKSGTAQRIVVGGSLFRTVPELWRKVGADGFTPDLRGVGELAVSD